MRIGILQTGHVDARLAAANNDYDVMFELLLRAGGFEFSSFDVERGVAPESPQQCDGWLVTGSAHGVYEDHAWISVLEAFIRDCADSGRPMVGICFGHQIMAQAMGAKVEKFAGGWRVGRQRYQLSGANGREQERFLLAMHQDQVLTVPRGASVFGQGEGCEIAALRFANWGWSIQPHPEFDVDFIRQLIGIRRGAVIAEDIAATALQSLDGPLHRFEIAAEIVEFFKLRGS